MPENKREMMKITIEMPNGDTRVVECHGIVATTLEDKGGLYNCGTLICGKLNIKDLIALHENVGNELISTIEKQIIAHTKPSDLLEAMLNILKED